MSSSDEHTEHTDTLAPDPPDPPVDRRSVFARLRDRLFHLAQRIDPSWLTRLTLVYLLLKPLGAWYLRAPMMSLVGLGLLIPHLHRKAKLWFAITAILVVRSVSAWTSTDNHNLLLNYWCLALALALLSRDPARILRTSSRSLIGLVFLFATLWKVFLSPDFMSGEFFRATLLVDSRFEQFSHIFTDVDTAQARVARLESLQIRGGDAQPSAVVLPETDRSIHLAIASTYLVALLEIWITLSFLLALAGDNRGPPSTTWLTGIKRTFARSKDLSLLSFAALTYPFATVAGFGWLLMIMGLAQCEQRAWKTRLAYLLSGWLILIHREVPWARFLAGVL